MPTYEYLCKQCGERFEKVQSFSARPLKQHATCGGELQKIFHASGVVFKGPGFYATDSRASRATADTSSDSTPDKSSNGSDKTSDATKKADAPKKAEKSPKTEKPASTTAAAAD